MLETPNQIATYSAALYDSSPTLLPENIASIITAIALATRLSIRCSSLLIEALIESVKYSTSFSFGLSRLAIINALSTAKKFHDLTVSSSLISVDTKDSTLSIDRNGFLKVLEKYTNLGIYVIYHSLTLAELFSLSGLHFTSQTIKSGFAAAEESVAIIDGIFGSNESSRAIASIIGLVHKELARDPEFKLAKIGKTAILSGLTKAITSFAILQNFTHTRSLQQMKINDLWKGVVVEEEKNERSMVQYHHKQENSPSSHPDIIRELEDILLNTSSEFSEKDDSRLISAHKQNTAKLRYNTCGEPYKLYEVTTTTKRITTKTTKIRPIDVEGKKQSYAKHIIERTKEEENEAFMAVVDSQKEQDTERTIPGAWPEECHERSDKKSVFRIMLTSVSKMLARKNVEHQERYGVISQHSSQMEPTFESPITKVTSTSTTLRSTVSANTHHQYTEQAPSVTAQKDLDRHKSWVLSRKKSVSDLIQRGAEVFSNKKKKTRSESPPRLPDNSSDNTSLRRSNSSLSSASLSSIARTLRTTTYHANSSFNCPPSKSLLETEPCPCNFPRKHIIANIAHFIRYASAAYGESFMRILGIGDIPTVLPNSHHPNHHAFAHHTGVSVSDILLSSYTDSGILSSVSHSKLHSLVHYVTVDHFSEAIVLTCRGTLGLSDILTDLTCDYKEFVLPADRLMYDEQKRTGRPSEPPRRFMAHGGMLEAAQLLAVQKGKVFEAIKRGLETYPDYGLVVCGHSLGAGVASLLSILWSEERSHFVVQGQDPKTMSCPFVTSKFSGLPTGRPIHCYTYGSPSVMSLALSEYCGQGLVTSVVHGFDIVSSLSLGLLKDFKNIAVSLHEESHVADEILSRIISYYQRGKANEITSEEEEDNQWFWALIKTMRADMKAEKLFPPSTTYLIESVPQLAKHTQSTSQTSVGNARESKHKMAYMVRFSQCKDIQSRFSEIVFSKTMFMDHSPNMYEKAIKLLNKGYFG